MSKITLWLSRVSTSCFHIRFLHIVLCFQSACLALYNQGMLFENDLECGKRKHKRLVQMCLYYTDHLKETFDGTCIKDVAKLITLIGLRQ